MKRFLIILGISLVLVGVIASLSYLLRQERKEVRRLSGNQRSLMEEVELYRTKDSLSAAYKDQPVAICIGDRDGNDVSY